MWQIIGHLNPRADEGRSPKWSTVNGRRVRDYDVPFGPHPRKRWVGPHVVKKYRVSKAPAGPAPLPLSSMDSKCEVYARWLAARDGVAIPAAATRSHVVKVAFTSSHRKRTSGKAVTEERATAVLFYIPGLGKPVAEIALPNWDFDPLPPVEEVLTEEQADALELEDFLFAA